MKYKYGFPQLAIEHLGCYVYLLIDPETDKVFYVGKGTGNRIFSHMNNSLDNPKETDKVKIIRRIIKEGKEIKHVILRHGLTEKEAFEVEASLIDYLGIEDLENLVRGQESIGRGMMSASDIIAQYAAEKITITEPGLILRVHGLYRPGMTAEELYEITRGNWVVGKKREKAEYAFSVVGGVVREVYKIHRWYPIKARDDSYKTQERWRFDGGVAEELQHYVFGDISHYISTRSQNPVTYVNC